MSLNISPYIVARMYFMNILLFLFSHVKWKHFIEYTIKWFYLYYHEGMLKFMMSFIDTLIFIIFNLLLIHVGLKRRYYITILNIFPLFLHRLYLKLSAFQAHGYFPTLQINFHKLLIYFQYRLNTRRCTDVVKFPKNKVDKMVSKFR